MSIILFVAVLLTTLFFGLRPKGFRIYNNVSKIANQPGIRFGQYGIAYTDNSFEPFQNNSNGLQSLSFEMALKPAITKNEGFKFLLVFYNGDDSKQLLIGQWRSSIVVMNGNDYDGTQRTKKIWAKDALLPKETRFVTITSGKKGTRIYLDGLLTATKKDLTLILPDKNAKARLIIGNSVYGRNSWTGDIYGLAIYGYVLSAQSIKSHFGQWSNERNFVFAEKDLPKALYLFDKKTEVRVLDRSEGGHHLEIPKRMQILKREILIAPWHGVQLNQSFVLDIIINLVGFIPLGFFLNAMLVKTGGAAEKHSALMTVFICFTISLFIEIAQSWMPSRSSQMLDLILNTFGAFIGVKIIIRQDLLIGSGFRGSRGYKDKKRNPER